MYAYNDPGSNRISVDGLYRQGAGELDLHFVPVERPYATSY